MKKMPGQPKLPGLVHFLRSTQKRERGSPEVSLYLCDGQSEKQTGRMKSYSETDPW